MSQKLAILDAGAQYAKVIDRRVRELNVESEILPLNTSAAKLKKYQAVIISGGPESVYGQQAPKYNFHLFEIGKPILGICYGMQLMAYTHQGVVEKKDTREDGQFVVNLDLDSPLFSGLNQTESVLLTHGDTVEKPGDGFRIIARSGDLIAGIENQEKKLYGVQFHPEVDLTIHGRQVLRNFLFDIAGFYGMYTMEDREQKAINEIQNTVGDKKVLVLVSGGVDSAVCAALVTKAIGSENVIALHIDNGLMRLNESQKVAAALENLGLNLKVVDASDTFYHATTKIDGRVSKKLNQTTHPEEKRKIIGDTFMRVAQQAISDLELQAEDVYLAQGTLRPDLIESASSKVSGNASVIKSHHNDTQLVRELREQGRVIEPLCDYHKDEVRELGKSLGLPEEIVWRQPFPGPGLGIRLICAEKPYITDDFESINQQLKGTFSDQNTSATLLPIQTVGVQGDGRTYSYLVALSGEQDWKILFEKAKQIPKTIHLVNRIVYVFGEKIDGPITSITPTKLTPDVISQLQQADDIVNQVLLKYDLMKTLSQVPVILFPVSFGEDGRRSIGIRTFITNDFMTGVPAVPGKDIPQAAVEKMVKQILKNVSGVSRVVYDLTSKPPGTTEWE